MKKVAIIIFLFVIAIFGYYFFKKENKPITENLNKQYNNPSIGISFTYPKILTASTTNGEIILHHDIPYKNTGACDMMGDEKTYEKLTDFEMTILKMNKNLTDTVKTLSPYIPQENFVNDEIIASPGFIDTYTIGNFSGFAIYEGAEGCGQTTYYFPIGSKETLIIRNASIQALSGAIIQEKVNEVLAVPGVIPREKNQQIFEEILKSLSY
jgi:hypothetical protein